MAAKSDDRGRVVAHNRKARFNYEIGETFEAGIALTGTEVKGATLGKANDRESYADARGSEIWLVNANIPEYLQAGPFQSRPQAHPQASPSPWPDQQADGGGRARRHDARAAQALLSTTRGRAKLELALAKGKKLHDKRETEKKRSWERERGRLLRAKG
jgi:SsrA-binding protein